MAPLRPRPSVRTRWCPGSSQQGLATGNGPTLVSGGSCAKAAVFATASVVEAATATASVVASPADEGEDQGHAQVGHTEERAMKGGS